MKNLRHHLLTLASLPIYSASAADLLWDGASVGGNGDGSSTYASGTWSTGNANWDQGNGMARLAWNNANLDNAVFGGTYATGGGNRIITIGSDITVNQIQILIGGAGSNSRYDIGANAAQNDFAITFGGSYSDVFPALTGNAGTNGFINNNFPAKVTGTVIGGLVIKHGSNITTPGTSGRFAFTNANSNFVGDVVMVGGNLSVGTQMGDPGNKLVLKGGALFISGGAGTSTFSRDIEVAGASGLGTSSTAAGQVMDLTGAITGSAPLTRYSNALTGSNSSEVRLSGDLSAFTGLFENTGNNANAIVTLQPTAPYGGSWKLTGGTLKLNSTDNTHIPDGAGKDDLLMNGGTLNLNGKSETINGLSGATGAVNNGLAATTSTLTLGAGDATASFGGAIQDGTGTVALTKTGTGTQILAGTCSFSGATTVGAGTLVMAGTMDASPITVESGAGFVVSNDGKNLRALTLEGGTTLSAPLDFFGSNYLFIEDALTFTGGTVTLVPTFSGAPALGTYPFIDATTAGITGSATLATDFTGSRVSGSAQVVDNIVEITISSVGANLVWNNGATTGLWDLDGDANFLNGASGDVFKQYDHVAFTAASPAGTVTLDGTLLPGSVTVDSPGNFTFDGSGSIAGPASLTKSGSGTLTVATTNTFTGATTVTAGTLAVTGTLGTGEVTVAGGATLTGTGALSGPVAVEGTLAPGASVGTLATTGGGLVLTGTYACEVDGAAADKLVVTGDLDLSGATLSLDLLTAPAAANYEIATYTGALVGTFASVPAGWVVDTSAPGKVLLWSEASIPVHPAGTITFETAQGYPAAPDVIAAVDGGGAAFAGTNGWSLVTAGNSGSVHATGSGGLYFGGQAIGASGTGTYIGGIRDVIQNTGANTITFDAPFFSGTSVGFMEDLNGNDLFDNTDGGMVFGVGGTPARFHYRNAAFGTEHFGTGFVGTAGHWYRFTVTIGASVGGNRDITMAVHNLTTNTGFDFNLGTPGVDPWNFTVTDAQFGTAPELSDGIYIRATSTARVDNIRATSVEPPPAGTAYDTWMDGFPGLEGDDRLADADPDFDGIENLLEFVLNGNPTTSDPSILPDASVTGGNLEFSFHRRDDAVGLVTLTFQHGINLSTWTDMIIGAESGAGYSVEELDAVTDLITVTLPAGGDPKKFARLLVNEAP